MLLKNEFASKVKREDESFCIKSYIEDMEVYKIYKNIMKISIFQISNYLKVFSESLLIAKETHRIVHKRHRSPYVEV
jgi:hypothetical protein